MTLDASFHESELYYLGEVSSACLQGESSNEDNALLKNDENGVEFFELKK